MAGSPEVRRLLLVPTDGFRRVPINRSLRLPSTPLLMRFPLARSSRLPWILAALICAACGADHYERQADRDVAEILGQGTERTLGDREQTVEKPALAPA